MELQWELIERLGFGGVLLFVVWWELKHHRLVLERMTSALTALLERARISDEDTGRHSPHPGYRKPKTPKHVDVVNFPRPRTHRSDEED